MNKIVYVWKLVGFTPFQLVEKFKDKYPEYKNEIVSYAGRLDPMAEGILILLVGEENKKRDKYLGLDKEYVTEVILGISTDTFDSLGLITEKKLKEISKKEIKEKLKNFLGKQKQFYPPYSSKTINGKPLFWWARENKINKVQIPEREIEIFSIDLLDYKKVKIEELIDSVIKDIEKIEGDFRQKEIINEWKNLIKNNSEIVIIQLKLRVRCSSGTYIRRLVDDLGKSLEAPAFARTIKRISIGDKREKDCIMIS